jgi:hypothetical protein
MAGNPIIRTPVDGQHDITYLPPIASSQIRLLAYRAVMRPVSVLFFGKIISLTKTQITNRLPRALIVEGTSSPIPPEYGSPLSQAFQHILPHDELPVST